MPEDDLNMIHHPDDDDADADDHNVDADAGELKVDADASVNGYQPVKEQPALTETCSMSFL